MTLACEKVRKTLLDKLKEHGIDLLGLREFEGTDFKKMQHGLFALLEIEDDIPSQVALVAMVVRDRNQIPRELLDEIVGKNSKRRESLERERDIHVDQIDQKNRARLGEYLKFVNREVSINRLIKHAAAQYSLYAQEGGIESEDIQWPACSGGPGLGKTTFCRKAFTRSIDGSYIDALWEGVKSKETFFSVVKSSVNAGRQYRISLGGPGPMSCELTDPAKSFSYRLLKCLTKNAKMKDVTFEEAPLLEDLLTSLTNSVKESLIVVNIDETNRIFEQKDGKSYLIKVLSAVEQFNTLQKGFVFCIMSGTNVRDLHDTLKAASYGQPPEEIPLPLLSNDHVKEIMEDLVYRVNKASRGRKAKVGPGLQFVLKVLGGVPRYVEALVFCLGKNETNIFDGTKYIAGMQIPPDPHFLLNQVQMSIGETYGSEFRATMDKYARNEGWTALLAASLFQWDIHRDDKIREYRIRELESRGVLFVVTTRDAANGRESFSIVFPLLFMAYVLPKSQECPMLLRHFDVLLSPDENERNTLAIFLLKCKALTVMNRPITVDALFPGCAPNLLWRETPLEFDRFELLEWQNQTWSRFVSEIQHGKSGFYVNAKGASFADMFIVSKNAEYAIMIQEKQVEGAKAKMLKSGTVPSFRYNLVQTEHDNCNIATPHLFVLVSDMGFHAGDWGKIQDNEIVFPCNEHAKAIGPLLALLRLHNHTRRRKEVLPQKSRKRQRNNKT
jgi:hypothetical protein